LTANCGVRVQTRADRCAAERQLVEVRHRGLEVLQRVLELRRPARDLLAERERRGVLQVGAPDLDDVLRGLCFFEKHVAQPPHRRHHVVSDRVCRRHVDRGGEGVVGGLALVDVVVGVDEPRLAALAAEDLARAVGQHLVDVHVGLRPAARLPHHQRELVLVLAREHLVGRCDDRLAFSLVEQLQLDVDERRGLLDQHQRADQLARHLLGRDLEVLQRALRLSAPQPVRRDRDLAEAVLLHARLPGH
jgi:hypothetical protein